MLMSKNICLQLKECENALDGKRIQSVAYLLDQRVRTSVCRLGVYRCARLIFLGTFRGACIYRHFDSEQP